MALVEDAERDAVAVSRSCQQLVVIAPIVASHTTSLPHARICDNTR